MILGGHDPTGERNLSKLSWPRKLAALWSLLGPAVTALVEVDWMLGLLGNS